MYLTPDLDFEQPVCPTPHSGERKQPEGFVSLQLYLGHVEERMFAVLMNLVIL